MISELRSELMDEVDEVWAETVRLLPLDSGLKDHERETVEFQAVIRTGERQGVKFRGSSPGRLGVMASGGQLRMDRLHYPNILLRRGDKLVAVNREDQPLFEVLSVDDRSHLRFICELGDA